MHLKSCSSCSNDFQLLREFLEAKPAKAEERDVDWIAARLAESTPLASNATTKVEPPASWLERLTAALGGGQAWAGAAAMAMLAAAVFLWQDSPPGLPEGLGQGPAIVRSGQLQAIAPVGDLPAAPTQLSVEAIAAAARYRFEMREVDRTVLWTAEADAPTMAIPSEISAAALPGKTLIWSATALDESGEALAQSPPTRFQVRLEATP